LAAFCAAFVPAFSLALPAANTPPGTKAVAAVRADPFIAKFKNSLREVIVSLPLFSDKSTLSPPAPATTHSEDLQVRPQPCSGLSLTDDSEIQKTLCDAVKALSSYRRVAVRQC
jgi:hypothetical protein